MLPGGGRGGSGADPVLPFAPACSKNSSTLATVSRVHSKPIRRTPKNRDVVILNRECGPPHRVCRPENCFCGRFGLEGGGRGRGGAGAKASPSAGRGAGGAAGWRGGAGRPARRARPETRRAARCRCPHRRLPTAVWEEKEGTWTVWATPFLVTFKKRTDTPRTPPPGSGVWSPGHSTPATSTKRA